MGKLGKTGRVGEVSETNKQFNVNYELMGNYLYTIAIDEYQEDDFTNLNNAKIDSERFKSILVSKYGFEVIENSIVDKEATRNNIIEGLNLIAGQINDDDTLIIFYAGHGEMHSITEKGYWIPSDATKRISDYIPNSTVIELIEAIQSKHTLLISDSCFSGTLLHQSRSGPEGKFFQKLAEIPSRWILASGRKEKVSDGIKGNGSPFCNAICEFLENHEDEYIPASELFNFTLKETAQKAKQQAVYGIIVSPAHEDGMIVFHNQIKQNKTRISLGLRDLTVSLTTGIEMKQLGFIQESLFAYYRDGELQVVKPNTTEINKICSAFNAQELHELIPEMIEIDTNTHIVAHRRGYDQLTEEDVEKYSYAEVTMQKTGGNITPYMAICRCNGRMVAFSVNGDGKYNNLITFGENQAEALAKMIIALKYERKID
ncbi:MAG: caspase family protein [Saprospiraceae bacterium]|nr:caspase family protein [Saprospiraceae bacterium]